MSAVLVLRQFSQYTQHKLCEVIYPVTSELKNTLDPKSSQKSFSQTEWFVHGVDAKHIELVILSHQSQGLLLL